MKYSSVYRKVPLFNVLQGHELFTRKHRSLWGLIPILHAAAALRRMCSSALCRGHCFTTCFRGCLSGRWLVPPSLSFPVTSVPHTFSGASCPYPVALHKLWHASHWAPSWAEHSEGASHIAHVHTHGGILWVFQHDTVGWHLNTGFQFFPECFQKLVKEKHTHNTIYIFLLKKIFLPVW